MRWLGDESHYFNFSAVLPVPDGCTLDTITGAIHALIDRHGSLRTLFPDYAQDPYQRLPGLGELHVTVRTAEVDTAQPSLAEFADELERQAFHHEEEWPIRFGVACVGTTPRNLIVVASHLVVDGGCWRILLDELTRLLEGHPVDPDPATWDALTLAEFQLGPKGRAMHDASMRYWRTEMRDAPASMFDYPCYQAEQKRYWEFTMHSAAAAVAADRIATARRSTTSAVLLAAATALISHFTGHRRASLQLIAWNRWLPQVRRLVAPMTEDGLFTMAVADASFADLVPRAWQRALTCFQNAAYDPADMDAEFEAVRLERGRHFDRQALFNDARVNDRWTGLPEVDGPEALERLRSSTVIERTATHDRLALKAFFYVVNAEHEAALQLQVDTAFIPAATAKLMLLGIEALLVSAAYGEVSIDNLAEITGIVPVERGQGWVQSGDDWAHLPSVADLVAGAPSVAQSDVFLETDADGGRPRIVAYVVPDKPDATVAGIHAEICAAIGTRVGVTAPDEYRVCAAAPPRDEPESWRGNPVTETGTGRRFE